jgi:murein DD-endopeptidase MepM/ murein hydrolase activator NlpD
LQHAPVGVPRVIGRVVRRAKTLVSIDTNRGPSATEPIAATTNKTTTHRPSDRVVVRARLNGTRRVPSRQMAHPLKPSRSLLDPRRSAARPVAPAAPTTLQTVEQLELPRPAPRRSATVAASSLALAHRLRDGVHTVAAHTLIAPRRHSRRAAFTLPSLPGPQLLHRIGHERAVALSVAVIVLAAASFSLAPSASGGRAGADTAGATPRIAVGGADFDASGVGNVVADYADTEPGDTGDTTDGSIEPDLLGDVPASTQAAPRFDGVDTDDPEARAIAGEIAAVGPSTVDGPFLSDGTLLKPVAVDTDVADGSGLMQTYKVKAGDTLSGIAHKFGVTMMTLYWANDLKSKDRLHQGQRLEIPPVTGLLIEVKATDTLAGLATEYKVDEGDILAANEISDPNLVLGQVLILPGAKGEAISTPKPSATTKPATSSSHTSKPKPKPAAPPKTYHGGRLKWPTTSHRLSQGFHYGHYGIDIDGDTGDPVWAAAGGTVTFAGWKNNGGGYQVWIAHGSGLYTTYNHMSSVAVSRGQHVARGQRVGRVGATGFATGSHLHFEVWRGPIWNGGRRVNPLAYL